MTVAAAAAAAAVASLDQNVALSEIGSFAFEI